MKSQHVHFKQFTFMTCEYFLFFCVSCTSWVYFLVMNRKKCNILILPYVTNHPFHFCPHFLRWISAWCKMSRATVALLKLNRFLLGSFESSHEKRKLSRERHFAPVNSISIFGMLTPRHLHGQKVKPRWRPMERILDVSFCLPRGLVRQF